MTATIYLPGDTMKGTLVPIRVSKISSNKYQELVYIPKLATRVLKLRKGQNIAIYVDVEENCIIIKPIEIKTK